MSKTFIQIIFVIESDKKAKTDEYYLRKIMDTYYALGNNKRSFVYMGSKYHFHNKKVVEQIEKLKRAYASTGGVNRISFMSSIKITTH